VLPSFPIKVSGQKKSSGNNKNQYFRSFNQKSAPQKDGTSPSFLIPRPTMDTSSFWSKYRWIFWISIYILLLMMMGMLFIQRVFLRKKLTHFENLLQQYQKAVDQSISQQNWTRVGVILLDLMYLCLSDVHYQQQDHEDHHRNMEGGDFLSQHQSVKNLTRLLSEMPSNVKLRYGDRIRQSISQLERLSFAPLEISRGLQNAESVKVLKQDVFQLLKDIKSC